MIFNEFEENIVKRYINSDLAVERKGIFDKNHIDASEYSEEEKEYCTVCRLNIMGKENCQKYGKKEGRYVTVFFENLSLINKKSFEDIAISIADEIKHILAFACEKDIRDSSVLVVGLGNSNLSVDAIGPLTLDKLMVTRHIGYEFKKECSVSAITPGVVSRTGIETVELVSATVEKIKPDVIVAVDALAAGSCERLGTTVQISDAGITPGSGVGNG